MAHPIEHPMNIAEACKGASVTMSHYTGVVILIHYRPEKGDISAYYTIASTEKIFNLTEEQMVGFVAGMLVNGWQVE